MDETQQMIYHREISEEKANLNENLSIYYKDVVKEWLSLIQMRVRESSYVKYLYVAERHLLPELGNLRLEEITTQCIKQFLEKELASGNRKQQTPLSPKYVNDIFTVLKETVIFSREQGLEIPCQLKYLSIKSNYWPARVLTIKEQTDLTRFLMEKPDICKTGVLLGLYTGMRIGEICALRWGNVRLDEGIIEVRFTAQRIRNLSSESGSRTRISVTSPKSVRSIRDIPLPEWLLKTIAPFSVPCKEAFFLSGKADHPMEPRLLQYKLRQYLNTCNITGVTFHTLRHTFATRCVEQSFEIKSLSEILGHGSVNITLNRYVHSSMSLKKENMKKLNIML